MNKSLKLRFVGFVIVLVAMVGAIAWSAHTISQRFAQLTETLTVEQLARFRIADEFQSRLLKINDQLLQFSVDHHPFHWDEFADNARALEAWITNQTDRLSTSQERDLFKRINSAYDGYLAVARRLAPQPGAAASPASLNGALDQLERRVKALLTLSINLAAAHRDAQKTWLLSSRDVLSSLRWEIYGGLLVLLFLGSWLAIIVYRDLIAPLRLKLAESYDLLESQEKLAALGELASGVAHEIRNPMTAIKARLFTLQKGVKPGSPEHEDAVVIGKEIHRLERIVKNFIRFASPPMPKLEAIQASQPLIEVRDLFEPTLRERGVQLELETAPDLWIKADLELLQQALINLVRNSADALGTGGGHIRLRAYDSAARLGGQWQPSVILEVADDGPGIPVEVEKRLFDPFFTTKDGGTGLGLSIAARIVEKHGGILQYQTRLKRGTTFGIVLARHNHEPRIPQNPAD